MKINKINAIINKHFYFLCVFILRKPVRAESVFSLLLEHCVIRAALIGWGRPDRILCAFSIVLFETTCVRIAWSSFSQQFIPFLQIVSHIIRCTFNLSLFSLWMAVLVQWTCEFKQNHLASHHTTGLNRSTLCNELTRQNGNNRKCKYHWCDIRIYFAV